MKGKKRTMGTMRVTGMMGAMKMMGIGGDRDNGGDDGIMGTMGMRWMDNGR